MKLSIGIVGLPNVGKSTLFKILTNQNINIANYPFATIDPNIGIVYVPDQRLNALSKISKSQKIIPAIIEFYDIAGLVRGAYKGEGLGNQFLSHIKETQAIVVVLRVFKDNEIIHVESSVDPIRDFDILNQELVFKDLETVSSKIEKLERDSKSGDKNIKKNLAILQQVFDELNNGNLTIKFKNETIVKELNLLTAKKRIYLLNGKIEDVPKDLILKIKNLEADYLIYDLKQNPDISDLIKKAYQILDLITFFTTGPNETRAWTILNGTKAEKAAGVIHSDFEKKFIRMEVVSFNNFILAGGWNEAKQKGLLKIEGRDYVVKDGDIVLARHSA
ncbi:MAG: YchF family ATPase [Patescibacteria group bacterium]|nr:YchF family ATPase [Patescibacteria group bacterium]